MSQLFGQCRSFLYQLCYAATECLISVSNSGYTEVFSNYTPSYATYSYVDCTYSVKCTISSSYALMLYVNLYYGAGTTTGSLSVSFTNIASYSYTYGGKTWYLYPVVNAQYSKYMSLTVTNVYDTFVDAYGSTHATIIYTSLSRSTSHTE